MHWHEGESAGRILALHPPPPDPSFWPPPGMVFATSKTYTTFETTACLITFPSFFFAGQFSPPGSGSACFTLQNRHFALGRAKLFRGSRWAAAQLVGKTKYEKARAQRQGINHRPGLGFPVSLKTRGKWTTEPLETRGGPRTDDMPAVCRLAGRQSRMAACRAGLPTCRATPKSERR